MQKQIISTINAPAAIGPYSQAVVAGDFIFLSGQIPINPATGKVEASDIEGQTHQVFANIKAILTEAGCSFDNLVKTTVFLSDMADFKTVNEIYKTYFDKDFPARSAVAVAALPMGVKIEIEVIGKR